MRRVVAMVLLAVLLSGCALIKPPCKAQVLEWRASVESPINRYEDAAALAFSTSRFALADVIKDMQAARREIGESAAPECGKTAKALLLEAQGSQISAMLNFAQNGDQQLFSNAWNNSLDIQNAYTLEMDTLTDKEWQQYRGVK